MHDDDLLLVFDFLSTRVCQVVGDILSNSFMLKFSDPFEPDDGRNIGGGASEYAFILEISRPKRRQKIALPPFAPFLQTAG